MKQSSLVLLLCLLLLSACGLSPEAMAAQTATTATAIAASWTKTSIPTITPTNTATAIPTPIEPFRMSGEVVEEWVNGQWKELKPPDGVAGNLVLGKNNLPLLILNIDHAKFDVPAQGIIGEFENGQWEFLNEPITLTRTTEDILFLSQNMRITTYHREEEGVNPVRGDRVVGRSGEIIGIRVENNATTNQSTLEFLMFYNDEYIPYEYIYLQPPEILYSPDASSFEGAERFINGQLSPTEVSKIMQYYQESATAQGDLLAGVFSITYPIFTPALDEWINQQMSSGNNFDTVCKWLGVPYIHDSPTIIDFCHRQHDRPEQRKIKSSQDGKDLIKEFTEFERVDMPIDQIEWWQPNRKILKADDNFWFYITIAKSKYP